MILKIICIGYSFTNLPNFGIVAINVARYGDDKYFLYDLMKK